VTQGIAGAAELLWDMNWGLLFTRRFTCFPMLHGGTTYGRGAEDHILQETRPGTRSSVLKDNNKELSFAYILIVKRNNCQHFHGM
jgi:hypothetical protein